MYPWVTHTWNLIRGKCPHNCRYCYMLGHPSWDVEIHLAESELEVCPVAWGVREVEHRFVFVGSSTDMFAEAVPSEMISRVLEHLRNHQGGCGCKGRHEASMVQYLFQTKNPARFLEFLDELPNRDDHRNTWLGTTVETNWSMYNWKDLLTDAPETLDRLRAMKELKGKGFELLISIEPVMDFDPQVLVEKIVEINPTMVSIGADSRSEEEREFRPIPEPHPRLIGGLVVDLENNDIGLHLKKNLGRLLKGATIWEGAERQGGGPGP